MPLTIPIKPLGDINFIDRFNDIYKIALSTKGQEYYVDNNTNKLYGFFNDYHSIIEVDIPFRLSTSVYFQGTNIVASIREVIDNCPIFFYSSNYPFFLFPESRIWDYKNENLIFTYGDRDNKYGIIDKITGKYCDDCIVTVDPNFWFMSNKHIRTLELYFNRLNYLFPAYEIKNFSENPDIIKIREDKVVQGARVISINIQEKIYAFYAFKNLIGPLTKTDKLDLLINQDRFEKDKFMVTFRVYKSNKLKIPEYNKGYYIDTHSFMINLV